MENIGTAVPVKDKGVEADWSSSSYGQLLALKNQGLPSVVDTTDVRLKSPTLKWTKESFEVRLTEQQISYLSKLPSIADCVLDIDQRMIFVEKNFEDVKKDINEVKKIKKSLTESKKMNNAFLATTAFFSGSSLVGFALGNVALGVGSLGPAAASLVGLIATGIKKDQ